MKEIHLLKVNDFTKLYWVTSGSLNPKLDMFGQFLESIEDSGIDNVGYFDDGKLILIDYTGVFDMILFNTDLNILFKDSQHYIMNYFKINEIYYNEITLNGVSIYKEPIKFKDTVMMGCKIGDISKTFRF